MQKNFAFLQFYDNNQYISFSYELTFEEIKPLIKPFIEQTLNICNRVLSEANFNPHDIDSMILVGGSTLNPYIRELIYKNMGIPLEFRIDPLTVVAQGAAIFASKQRIAKDKFSNQISKAPSHEKINNVIANDFESFDDYGDLKQTIRDLREERELLKQQIDVLENLVENLKRQIHSLEEQNKDY